jgi:hypothetical protein
MSALTKLSAQVHNQLRSSIIITNSGQLVEELVCNSIDAGAKKVSQLSCMLWGSFMHIIMIWYLHSFETNGSGSV